MKINLPNVTLVMIETREHELARIAVEDCVRVAKFGEVLILTDATEKFAGINATFRQVGNWPDKLGWCRSMWLDVPPLLRTSHMLGIQWDSWIADVSMWRDEFLNYDFIGAPWWYKDGKNVGNSGFCLKSTRLARYIAARRDKFPCTTSLEDDLLCRKYRHDLEKAGFTWAPEALAHEFAFECTRIGSNPAFGFHAMFNWPEVLDKTRMTERIEIALRSPYIRDSYMLKALCQKHPQLIKDLIESDRKDA